MRSSQKLGCSAMVTVLVASSAVLSAQMARSSGGYFPGGSVTGVIVDGEGIPQMGALVQLLLPDATPAATVLTDSNGRYKVSDLRPGRYRVRVSAALFLPAVRQTLQIGLGTRAVVNMTLSTLLASGQWLPATRRTSNAADDDWMWTLRSSAMRPVLRIVTADADADEPLAVSSSVQERRAAQSRGTIAFQESDGAFAHGGTHQVFTLERAAADGSGAALRADFSGPRAPYPVAPSAEVTAGWQQKLPLGTSTRSTLTYVSHPELQSGQGSTGMQGAVLRNAQRMELGDTLRVDAGSVTRVYNLGGNAIAMDPFIRVAYRAGSDVVIAYAFTAAQGTSQLEDLDRLAATTPLAVAQAGHLRLTRGHANAISLGMRTPQQGRIEISAYRESITNPLLSGIGSLASADTAAQAVLLDPSTQTFVVASRNLDGSGVRLSAEQPLTPLISIGGDIADGTVLTTVGDAPLSMGDLNAHIGTGNAVSASVHGRARLPRSGTQLEAGYRWQRSHTLSAVDSFRTAGEPAYLHARIRQSLAAVPMLPNGLELMVAVQNLLEEGYQPLLSSDGRTLYLAQTPRMLQAGLSFTF